MKIKKKLQKLFKKTFQRLFILIYGKVNFNANYNFLDNHDLNTLDQVKIDNLSYKCFTITDGRVYTNLVESVSIISNNHLVPGASCQKISNKLADDKYNLCLTDGTPRIKKKISGTIFCLIQDASGNNYAHWLVDILPRLKIFEQNNSIDQIDYFLLPELKNNFQYETLDMLNIPLTKVLNVKKNRHIQSKKLILTEHPWYKKDTIHSEMINIPKWIVLWLREKFLKNAEYDCAHNKIFIDRSDSNFNHCKIINNEQVWQFLEKKGFKKYKLSEMSFKKQIGLFNSADIIVGAHGAGLSNIIFSKSNSKVIEIKPAYHKNKFFYRLAQINNLNHHEVFSKDLKSQINDIDGDIIVDLKDILKLVD